MSDASESAAPSGLSFERAEFEHQPPAGLSCGYCQKPLNTEYWQIAKRPACAECRAVVERELLAAKSAKRFLSALQYGGLAAVAGCLGWMLVSTLLHGQFGFVAIGLGYLIGKAVRKGAHGQGGTRYQILAVFLSYSAIVLASIPNLLHADSGERVSALWAVGIAYVLPFLDVSSNLIGLFIIAIALYEAWKLTRALPLSVLGPFAIDGNLPAEPTAVPDAAH